MGLCPSHAKLPGGWNRVSGGSDVTPVEGLLGEYYEGKEKEGSGWYK